MKRFLGSVVLMGVVALNPIGAATASAQDDLPLPIEEDPQTVQEVFDHVLPGTNELIAQGLTSELRDAAKIIEIYQMYGVGAAYEISLEEAQWLVEQLSGSYEGYAAVSARFGQNNAAIYRLVRAQVMSCADRNAKQAAARRLSRALAGISALNVIGAGIATATGAGAVVAPAFGFGALVTGFSSQVANWVAQDLGQMQCISGVPQWRKSKMILASTDTRRVRPASQRPVRPYSWA